MSYVFRMWSLKLKVREKWNIYNYRTNKFKIKLLFYSHNYYEDMGRLYFVASGIIEGDEKRKKKFIEDMKKESKIQHFESNDDFFICIYSELKSSNRSKVAKIAYNPRLIFVKPVIIDEFGWEEWEIASPERKDVDIFLKHSKNLPNTESKLFYLKQQKINNLMIYAMLPKLTAKQKNALVLAVANGYYGYPRKTKLKYLAKLMKISLSTYQFHLAKAEAKLMPFLVKKF